MSGLGPRRPKTYDDALPPPNYVPGVGRGATGFVTRSDIGPADAVEAAPQSHMSRMLLQGGAVEEQAMFQDTPYDEDDKLADAVFAEVDERMEQRRKSKKQAMEDALRRRLKKENADALHLFEDCKDSLKDLTEAQWDAIPEVRDRGLKRKHEKDKEARTPTPDFILQSKMAQASLDSSIDTRSVGGTVSVLGTDTPLSAAAGSKMQILERELKKSSDSVTGQTNIEPKGYLTSLSHNKVMSSSDIQDINVSREVNRRITLANPGYPHGWVAYARLEALAGDIALARKIIREGCENCKTSEEIWLEAARIHPPSESKSLLASGIYYLPGSVKLWEEAALLETDIAMKRKVLWRALEHVPNSVKLWQNAVSLEEPEAALLLLRRAVTCVPESEDLWLALAKLETYDNAKDVLNQARKRVPTSVLIWLTAAQLEETNGSVQRVDGIIEKAMKSLGNNGVVIDRYKWLEHAQEMELSGSIHTCGAVVRHVLQIGVEREDRKRTWIADADRAIEAKAVETAKAVYMYALAEIPFHEDLWVRALDLEDSNGTTDSVLQLLQQSVKNCPSSLALWLRLVRHQYRKIKDVEGARATLRKAIDTNRGKDSFVSNEEIWLVALQIEWEENELEKAREILNEAREKTRSARVWMKSALLEWENDNAVEEERLLREGIRLFPDFPKL